MKLTVDLIGRRTSGQMKKKREEDNQHYLRRLTHLYLEDCKIDEIVSYSLPLIKFLSVCILNPKIQNTYRVFKIHM